MKQTPKLYAIGKDIRYTYQVTDRRNLPYTMDFHFVSLQEMKIGP